MKPLSYIPREQCTCCLLCGLLVHTGQSDPCDKTRCSRFAKMAEGLRCNTSAHLQEKKEYRNCAIEYVERDSIKDTPCIIISDKSVHFQLTLSVYTCYFKMLLVVIIPCQDNLWRLVKGLFATTFMQVSPCRASHCLLHSKVRWPKHCFHDVRSSQHNRGHLAHVIPK